MTNPITVKETSPINELLGQAYDLLSDLKPALPVHRIAQQEMMDRIAALAFATTLFWHPEPEIAIQRLSIEGGVQ